MDDITIGSDPEFGFISSRGQIRASSQKDICCFEVSGVGEIGLDGHADIAELRPKQSADVRQHIRNIRTLLGSMAARSGFTNHIGVYAGSWIKSVKEDEKDGDGIGGHIHFGLASGRKMRSSMREDLLVNLDYWLAPIIMLLEKEDTSRCRRVYGTHGHPYGRLKRGRYRFPPWGLEYRPLSSWIVAPHIAQAVLCYAKAIAWASINHKMPKQPYHVSEETLCTKYEAVDRRWLKQHFNKIHKSWRLFPLVTENKYIASGLGILNHLIINNLEWREDVDLRDSWNLRSPSSPPVASFNSDVDRSSFNAHGGATWTNTTSF